MGGNQRLCVSFGSPVVTEDTIVQSIVVQIGRNQPYWSMGLIAPLVVKQTETIVIS